jgi:hypothetical protein
MKSQNLRWLAWGFVGIYAFLVITGSLLQLSLGVAFADIPVPAFVALYTILGLWVVLGSLIVTRHPYNPVGWLLCIGMALPALDPFFFGYVMYSLRVFQGSLPGTVPALIWLNWSGMPFGVYILTLLMLLFPDGHLLSNRWRILPWVATGSLVVYITLKGLEPGDLFVSGLPMNNPAGVPASTWESLAPVMGIGLAVMVVCYSAAWWSLAIRLRRGKGEERQQVKWILPPAALFAIGIPVIVYGESTNNFQLAQFGGIIHMIAVSGIILGSSFAIFKYHLYDIDIIIRRTLVYGLLTGSLAIIYLTSVTLLQGFLTTVSGQQSTVAIVISTLAVAALFTPFRHRIQSFIDRRFYRSKYDVDQALSAFSVQVRDVVDLERLMAELLRIVDDTVQPASSSLWLKEREASSEDHPPIRRPGGGNREHRPVVLFDEP